MNLGQHLKLSIWDRLLWVTRQVTYSGRDRDWCRASTQRSIEFWPLIFFYSRLFCFLPSSFIVFKLIHSFQQNNIPPPQEQHLNLLWIRHHNWTLPTGVLLSGYRQMDQRVRERADSALFFYICDGYSGWEEFSNFSKKLSTLRSAPSRHATLPIR